MLDDFTPDTVEIMHKGRPLMTVRGLNLIDLSIILRDSLPAIRNLVDAFDGSRNEIIARIRTDAFMLNMLTEAPELVATIVAHAADKPDMAHKILSMPVALQLLAAREVVRMTLEDMGGPKAFAALLMKMTNGTEVK